MVLFWLILWEVGAPSKPRAQEKKWLLEYSGSFQKGSECDVNY